MSPDEQSAETAKKTGSPPFGRRPLKVALVALYYDYGRPARGLSYEYQSFYLCFKELFEQVVFFDYYTIFLEKGKQAMNQALLAYIKAEKPDLTVFPLFQDEFDPAVLEELKRHTTTLCYFFDDIWRVDFANYWAPRFDYITTPSTSCLRRYASLGYKHAIYSPLGYNHFVFKKKDLPKLYDVSFVGGSHPYRSWMVNQLARADIRVAAWGGGRWPAGRLTHEAMIDVFNQTRINLNISNGVHWHLPFLLSSLQAVKVTLTSKKTKESVKARHFEICGCGGFQLAHPAEDLDSCFRLGEELVIYNDVDELIAKIRYYLKEADEREAIATAGHRRALAEHTFARRFTQIVDHIWGAPPGPARLVQP